MKRLALTSDRIFGFAYILLFAVFMAIALLHRGLFFAPEKVTASTIVVAGALVTGIIVTLYPPLRKHYRVPWSLWLMFGYTAYAWLTTLWAANAEYAVQGALIDTAAVGLAAFVPLLTRTWRAWLLSIIAFFGPALYLFAMGAALKYYNYTNAIQAGYMDSVFQYHNTFGAFSLAAALIGALLAVRASNVYVRAWYLLNSALSIVGVVVSYSRWVWILTAIMIILSFLSLISIKRTRDGFYALVFAVLPALAASPFALSAIHHASKKQFAVVLVIALVGAIIGTLVLLGVSKIKKKWQQVVIPSVFTFFVLVVAVVLVHKEASKFSSVSKRIGSITLSSWSMRQRFWFYGAAMHMWEHNPIFGAGAGAWNAKFQAYQQFPFWSTMTHSVVMSQLVSFGLIGLILWLGFLAFAFRSTGKIVRKRNEDSLLSLAAILALLVILLHSLFDFDMNFATVVFVVFVLLATAATPSLLPVYETSSAARSIENHLTKKAWWLLLPCVASLGLVYVGGTLGVSEIQLQAAGGITNTDAKIAKLQSAQHYAPYTVQPHLQLAEMYYNNYLQSHALSDQEDAWRETQWASRRGIWDPSVLATTGVIAYNLGHISEAVHWTQGSYQDGKLTTKYSETFLGVALWSGVREAQKYPADAKSVFQSVVNTYNAVQANENRLQHLPKEVQQQWQLTTDAPMTVYMATAEYALGNFQQSLSNLQSLPTTNRDPNTMSLAQMVGLLDKANMNHQPTINLVSKLPNRSPQMLNEFEALASIHNG
ncbi:O-antigen ligase family protein [Alicyclobacillus ferrooxydans]|uniref:O-antigen ligase-related domain-containing protein n=1 Tax=Alicyclobacillus ferrooxydans TaxID=471514 RepID=A0A0P9CZF0_9BACL|nr:O-antigen ligase family protein [Alicyclobacillus ferrooxydans]KPV42452.1 hypothetical protein AN477_17860 [Alicyclobacillus ferrooxydans]